MSNARSNGDFILASASPRRQQLLRQVGLFFHVVPSRVREVNHTKMDPTSHVLHWAAAKAGEVAQRYPRTWVLGADTIVVLDEQILGKPAHPADAVRMLSLLSGRSHRVISGLCLQLRHGQVEERVWVETVVFMKRLGAEEIRGYVATGEPLDKAGAYGIQGIGGCLVQRIEGSYSNVVGLPLCEMVDLLRRHEVADPYKISS
ncbi:MAG: Maf family protein [Syntrophobacteria bacterium]